MKKSAVRRNGHQVLRAMVADNNFLLCSRRNHHWFLLLCTILRDLLPHPEWMKSGLMEEMTIISRQGIFGENESPQWEGGGVVHGGLLEID